MFVPETVAFPFAVRVNPSWMVSVDPVAGAVRVTLFIVVAEATPRVGVVSVGLVARTTLPDPVVEAAEMAVPLPERIPVTLVVKVMLEL